MECEEWSFESPARTSWVKSQWARTGPWKRDPSAGFAGASPSSATMPHLSLPPELLDHVIDNLSLTRDALKTCCLVSESWIPRVRKHLFANIEFLTPEHLQSWKNLFQNPTTSPARYTKTLLIKHPCVVTTGDGEDDGWILSFSRVVRLEVDIYGAGTDGPVFSLVPFHGFSPALKSLHLIFFSFSSSQISDLIFSFPLLEDLLVFTSTHHPTDDDDDFNQKPDAVKRSSSPAFTGSLDLCLAGRADSVILPLLSLSNGLHFRKLRLMWAHAQDVPLSTELVKECSSTLEFLAIRCEPTGTPVRHPRSRKRLTFVCR